MSRFVQLIGTAILLFTQPVLSLENRDLIELISQYKQVSEQLGIPPFQLGYLENLNSIQDAASRNSQKSAFQQLHESLLTLDNDQLAEDDKFAFDHLLYRLDLHLQRLALEDRFRNLEPNKVTSTEGIYFQPLGREWYTYSLRNWLSVDRTPEWLMNFGEREVAKVQAQFKQLIEQTGFKGKEKAFYQHIQDPTFILTDKNRIIEGYRRREQIVQTNLSKLFLNSRLPEYAIEPWPQSNKDTPPARVVIDPTATFQFGFYQNQHNKQDMDFIYLHEAVPGHLYAFLYDEQSHYDTGLSLPAYAYHGFSEGWGAYVEELGNDLGLYQTPYDLLGKLKFDLVRSARVVLDVGINYYGWDNDKALAYWHDNIKGQDFIAQREIDRVRRWPGQAISYKVGADTFLTLKQQAKDTLGEKFDIREFHHQILGFGGVPLFLVERRIQNYINILFPTTD